MGVFFCLCPYKYSLSLVVFSKLDNIAGAYNSKVKLLLPNFETTWQGALFEGHNKKRHPCPSLNVEQILIRRKQNVG